ncbi:recombinase RecT [Ruminococcus sp.]|uniref:recombinase RecT n=1 Tax=Ruminococcus sp. TaxID=41978 RepID=UPI0025CF6ECA|nr:recombinase RecT [Ruminococcus sp.]
MPVNNQLIPQQEQKRKVGFSEVINSIPYQRMIANTLKDRATANRFISSIVSAVATSPALQECTPKTVVSAALLGEGLKLSPSPQLGQFYMVPFKQKEKTDRNGNVIQQACTNATFVLGYKGYIQLATRSGEYKRINAMPIKEGELISYNPFDDEIELEYIQNDELREGLPTIGYYAMFEYHNGFKKVMYWSKDKMLAHADKYSPAFSAQAFKNIEEGKISERDMWKYSSFWYKDFDGMACKTMLRQLISKWGLMSIDMQKAFDADGGIIGDNGEVTFSDSEREGADEAPATEIIEAEIAEETPEPTPEPQEQASADDFAHLING